MVIKDGKIADIPFRQSPNVGAKFAHGLPDTIVIHYTAGASAESSITSLCDPKSKASAHLVIARDGRITQLVAFDTIAWHAGQSKFGNRVGLNQYSIGIEIDNAGILEKRGDKYYSWFNREYPENEVVMAVHRNQSLPQYWHAYTEAQLNATFDVCQAIMREMDIKEILGHEEISPGRKVDPGPAFPLDRFRERLKGGGRDEDTEEELTGRIAEVTADLLNIRSGPSTDTEKVAMPLRKKQKVKILETMNGWVKVSTEISGWVSAKHIQ